MRIGTRVVRTPAGVEWGVGRRWISRRLPRWRKVRVGKPREGDVAEAVLTIPDPGGLDDIGAAILVFVALVVVVFVVVPLLLFGVELIILGLVLAASIAGRTLLGRPWIIQAGPVDGDAQVMAWKVRGLRRSARVIGEVAVALEAGLDPVPGEAAERMADASDSLQGRD
jgi:hypothetical protein